MVWHLGASGLHDPEVFLQCWHSVNLGWMRRQPDPSEAYCSCLGPRPCGLALAGGQSQACGPEKESESLCRHLSSTSHVLGRSNWTVVKEYWLGLEFQWSGLYPRLFTYYLYDIGHFTSLTGLSFLSIKWYRWAFCVRRYLVRYRVLVGVMYVQMMMMAEGGFWKED